MNVEIGNVYLTDTVTKVVGLIVVEQGLHTGYVRKTNSGLAVYLQAPSLAYCVIVNVPEVMRKEFEAVKWMGLTTSPVVQLTSLK